MSAPFAFVKMTTSSSEKAVWRKFSRPVQVVETSDLNGVKAKLAEVERLTSTGLYAVGFVSYEAAPAFEPAFPVRATPDFPLLWFALFQDVEEVAPHSQQPYTVGDWKLNLSRAEYDAGIARVRAEIAAGNTYQVNFTGRLRTAFGGDALAFFSRLSAAQDTEYSAFIDTGRFQILSVSPELFFRVEGETLTTKPMKGTTGRGLNEAGDAAQAAWLKSSVKDRAENVMIVDLLRNDLGRVAQFGSVRVTELCAVEKYPTLLTMTSTVQAVKRRGIGLVDIFTALFPCGSVTGAPKINTMHLIHELEPQARRVYCGAVGLVEPGDGVRVRAVFNVPIRTVLIDSLTGVAEYGAGGGITWDSEAGGEYDELLTKSRVLTSEKQRFELLETLRLQQGQAVNAPLHLERLASSARYFGFVFDVEAAWAALRQASQDTPTGTHRLRLLLSKAGEITVQTLPLGENPPVVRAHLARTPMSSRDVFLYHKTTQRAVYGQHTQNIPAGEEVLLFNERGELTEFTAGNVVLELDGRLYTPPIASGLLAGIERRRAIEENGVAERMLTVQDLQNAQTIWHLNSLRGWRRVELLQRLSATAR
ncbi:aminodeoxychorismate synthase component I [Deinococcus fonticola]|uniref:aminodeoxychorismate synthase component I n=1 Tax=Deinococcus fonticola TaxID=2528713 RepID=UPI0010752131|nr:aminodeoxychorismate synthase component I [Deinococcus fonticola]